MYLTLYLSPGIARACSSRQTRQIRNFNTSATPYQMRWRYGGSRSDYQRSATS